MTRAPQKARPSQGALEAQASAPRIYPMQQATLIRNLAFLGAGIAFVSGLIAVWLDRNLDTWKRRRSAGKLYRQEQKRATLRSELTKPPSPSEHLR